MNTVCYWKKTICFSREKLEAIRERKSILLVALGTQDTVDWMTCKSPFQFKWFYDFGVGQWTSTSPSDVGDPDVTCHSIHSSGTFPVTQQPTIRNDISKSLFSFTIIYKKGTATPAHCILHILLHFKISLIS